MSGLLAVLPELIPEAQGDALSKRSRIRALLYDAVNTHLEPGDPFPSERQLAQHFGVARMTVRGAIDDLVGERVLERSVGIGTSVARQKLDVQMQLTSYSEEMSRRGMVPDAKVLSFGLVPANRYLARELHVAEGAPLVRFKRQLLADSEPMSVDENYLRADLVPGLADGPAPEKLYRELGERYGLVMEWGQDTIEATSADKTHATLLSVEVGTPLLRIERRAYVKKQLVDFSISFYRADRYKLWVPLQRKQNHQPRNYHLPARTSL